MFERFDQEARQVVARAHDEAVAMGHGYVGTEHLLLGLLGTGPGVTADVLGATGVTPEEVRKAVAALVGPAPGPGDAAALRTIGIDLDAVRATIEDSFGPGALDRARCGPAGGGRNRDRRRRRFTPGPLDGGTPPLTPRTKKVLELALRHSLHLRHDHIGPEHVLLGLLTEGEGLAATLLVARGLRLDDLRRRVLAALGQVA